MSDVPLVQAAELAVAAARTLQEIEASPEARVPALEFVQTQALVASALAATAIAPHPDGYDHRDDCPCRCVSGGPLDESCVWLSTGLVFELMVTATKLAHHADTLPPAYASHAELMRQAADAVGQVLDATPGVTRDGQG